MFFFSSRVYINLRYDCSDIACFHYRANKEDSEEEETCCQAKRNSISEESVSDKEECMRTDPNMEADVSQDFQDYWNEYRIIQETKLLDDYLDEEYGSRDGMFFVVM